MGSAEVADCRDHGGHAAGGWGGECGSSVNEVDAYGNAPRPQAQGACEQTLGGQQRTSPPSCAGG